MHSKAKDTAKINIKKKWQNAKGMAAIIEARPAKKQPAKKYTKPGKQFSTTKGIAR